MMEKKSIKFFEESYSFDEHGGMVSYYVFVNYETLGEFTTNDSVNVVVIIKDFVCHEKVLDKMINELKQKIKSEMNQRFPDIDGNIEILMVTEENLKKATESTFDM